MQLLEASKARSAIKFALISAATLGALAAVNTAAARLAERRHPPSGRFIEVDGVWLHYTDRGKGSPVVLIHGNTVTGSDWDTSGVADLLLRGHRVIIFDRPGFGYSDRPRGRVWTATQQAELLHKALWQMGIEQTVVVGHSWGTLVALELAAHYPADTAGLVLVSGYYFWTLRPDVLLVVAGAVPVLGDILRYTVSPLLGWLQMPLLQRAIFSPARVPHRFRAEYSPAMALRPSQIRATSVDGVLMIPGALALRGDYKNLSLPVVIIAGEGDKVVFKRRSERLAANIRGSALRIIKDAGHMVHHLAPRQVEQAVEDVLAASGAQAASPPDSSFEGQKPTSAMGLGVALEGTHSN